MRKYRSYEDYLAHKRHKKNRCIVSIILAAAIATGGYVVYKNMTNNTGAVASDYVEYPTIEPNVIEEEFVTPEPTIVPTAVPTEVPTPEVTPVTYVNNGVNKGDSVVATSNVNLRLGPTKDSFKLGELPKNTTVDRILSFGNWDLVRYDGRIAFVSSDYTSECEYDYNNEYYYVEECNDIVRTTSKLYFRTGPSKNESDICLLNKNTELVVMGRAIPYFDINDVWYLVKYKDQIGFVNAAYTVSLKDKLSSTIPDLTDLTILKMAYVETKTPLLNSNGDAYKQIGAYQMVKVLVEYDGLSLVEYGDSIGLVHSADIKEYKGTFVVVDLSDQQVFLYCNTDMVFESACTTGKNGMETRTGAFKVSERTNSRYFSEEAQARYMWARFDGGNGFHDAPWEDPKNFGVERFRAKSGSKGCVRLPDYAAMFLRYYIKVGTKVLVKE